jgi:hypothetical protein
MKLFGWLMSAMLIFSCIGCAPEEESSKTYPSLDSIANTLWYSVDTTNQIYYDIYYKESTGVMERYSNSLRDELISSRNFTYTFTPATSQIDALVNLTFEDGERYGGILIPKGNFQVNDEDVYWIQLYEVDEMGEIILDENGKIKSSILMWLDEKKS